MSIGSSEEAKSLAKDIDSGVVVSVVSGPAGGTSPVTNLEILGAGPLLTAGGAELAGWEEAVYRDQLPSVPLRFVGELPAEFAPSSV